MNFIFIIIYDIFLVSEKPDISDKVGNDEVVYKILRQVLDQIEENRSFEFIRATILKHKSFIVKVINSFETIDPLVKYKSQKEKKILLENLNLPENLIALHSRADGNCLYNSLSYLFFWCRRSLLSS